MPAPREPLGTLGQDARSLNSGSMAQVLNELGTWVLELEDRSCFQRIVIEVRPPNN
jgi:hypothetical protein